MPISNIATIPKKVIYVSLPYVGIYNKCLKQELTKTLSTLYPMANFRFCFPNPFTIQNLFKFKDSLPELMQSQVVYKYTCPKCNLGTYIGSTERMLRVRIDSHRGVSHRTGCDLNTKEASAVRSHSDKCTKLLKYQDFKILAKANNSQDLLILESLFIKSNIPHLNNDTSSTPLYIA